MDDFKRQIERRLIANVLIDKCTQNKYLIFRDAWCTQERVVRFTTPFFREMFPNTGREDGMWKTGDHVMFEVHNQVDSLVIECVLHISNLSMDLAGLAASLMKSLKIENPQQNTVLKSWDFAQSTANLLFSDFDDFLDKELSLFEKELAEKVKAKEPREVFSEGEKEQNISMKYERNAKARAACIAAHGTACAVCGIDFAEVYGPEFAGKIEVHHIVPLSEIGEKYVVDPVKDLVPLCPNCHTAIHSKKGGTYTVEELKRLLKV